MIYDTLKAKTARQTKTLREEIDSIADKIKALDANILLENSRRCVLAIQEEKKALRERQRELWRARDRIELDAFKSALAIEYGVGGNPKFQKAFDIAWSHGHSSGFNEVEIYFADMIELIK